MAIAFAIVIHNMIQRAIIVKNNNLNENIENERCF